MIVKARLAALLTLALAAPARADEGMWMPQQVPDLAPRLARDVPVDFLSSVDTTGGNSGSAVLNARGELVGLLSDGTRETIASDFLFDAESTRSIQVDSRYLLWFLTDVAKASNLLQELRAPVQVGAR